MKPDDKSLTAKQVAFTYGIILSIMLGFAGTLVISFATESILYNHQFLTDARERYIKEADSRDTQYKQDAANKALQNEEHFYNITLDSGQKFILVGMGLLVLAEIIAYVPMSLYAENGKELLKDHSKKKR